MIRLARLSTAAFVLCVLAAACSDPNASHNGLAPDGGPLLEIYDPAIEVGVLQRSVPLAADVSVSSVIGKAGGRMEIPAAGLRVDFPSNSLRSNTRITVTALRGSEVAYTFEPHGLVFRQEPLVRQSFKGTNAASDHAIRDLLEGAYFQDTTALLSTGRAKILETRPTFVDVTGSGVRFSVAHFSGYLVSTGRRGGYISSTGNRVPAR